MKIHLLLVFEYDNTSSEYSGSGGRLLLEEGIAFALEHKNSITVSVTCVRLGIDLFAHIITVTRTFRGVARHEVHPLHSRGTAAQHAGRHCSTRECGHARQCEHEFDRLSRSSVSRCAKNWLLNVRNGASRTRN